ncbi:hypothetical protein CYY_004238 [Polysphondylium violaceum]|uniref:FNIP repeat-containing protein n=1 Tax=Polysphondylium violaceum TaxID=133409 RepID=A0A8J4Q5S1_9MYCE|nr:hypothetical protein CYY_004238 [Polysphondylium violaceum]
MDRDFFNVWRNRYIRSRLNKCFFDDLQLKVTLNYCKRNEKDLHDLLVGTNAFVHLDVVDSESKLSDYLGHPCASIINKIDLKFDSLDIPPDIVLPPTIKMLGLYDTVVSYTLLPQSLTALVVHNTEFRPLDDSYGTVALPSGLKHLEDFISTIDKKVILECRSLESFTYTYVMDEEKGMGSKFLPPNLKEIDLGILAGPIGEDVLPQSLTKIYGSLDIKRLKSVAFSSSEKRVEADIKIFDYDEDLALIKPWMVQLTIHDEIHSIPEGCSIVPDHITVLSLARFNIPLQIRMLPNCLVKLEMQQFNQDLVPGLLPESLRYLWLSNYKRYLQPNVLPSKLIQLEIHDLKCLDIHPPQSILPDSLKILEFYYCRDTAGCLSGMIPSSVTRLLVVTHDPLFLDTGVIPPSVVDLELLYLSHFEKVVIPPSVVNLKLKAEEQPQLLIPTSVQTLSLGFIPTPGFIPGTVKKVYFKTSTTSALKPGVVPLGCQYVYFQNLCTSLSNVLPASITTLVIKKHTNVPEHFLYELTTPIKNLRLYTTFAKVPQHIFQNVIINDHFQ